MLTYLQYTHDQGENVKHQLAVLEAALLKCQQSVEIPDINLEIHPVVASTITSHPDGKAVVEDLGAKATDQEFLNELIKGWNSWKTAIRSITDLDWDITAGTTIDEINFWMSKASHLQNIAAQLKHPAIGE